MEIRNIAIIAHVDHGKTTLTDALMLQTGMFSDASFSMDSNDLEKERGITIYSKNTSVFWKNTKINIVDTPGHADFSSEVERVLRAIDTVLLLVDAQEGPMPQTRFVLKKSLELGLKPIVIINKIDKAAARPEQVHEEVLELFIELGANNEQIDFQTIYAIGRQGVAKRKLTDESKDLSPLLDAILEFVPPAKGDISAPFRMQPFNLAYDNFLGRLAIGRVYEGRLKTGALAIEKKPDGSITTNRITKLYTFEGLTRKEVKEAQAGDIVVVAGFPEIYIGDTLCEKEEQTPLPAIAIDEPTISLDFFVSDSPFAGKEGKFVTTRQIKERLGKELEVNVGLRVDFSSSDHCKVFGRGELHIAILLENMRREGFELQVSEPQVITKEKDGVTVEPFEEAIVDVPNEYVGDVIQKLGARRGVLMNQKGHENQTRLIFEIPTRGLLGYKSEFVIDTKGEGILSSRFIEFRLWAGDIQRHNFGSMVSMESGTALGYSLFKLQERSAIYIDPAVPDYEGMIIGNVSKGDDLDVNPTKNKILTNYRNVNTGDAIMLIPPLKLTIERGLEIMKGDEYLEITPKSVRLRKKFLTKVDRSRATRGKE